MRRPGVVRGGTSCTAAWNQVTFRFRDDDGDQAGATWRQNQNTQDSQTVDTNYRCRVEIQETAGCAGSNKVWQAQYNLNNTGWNNITAASNVVRASASPNEADAANLTDQLTNGTGTFQGNTGFDEVNGAAGGSQMDVVASGHAEAEFCYQIRSADVTNGDTIWLRATDNGNAFAAYGSGNAVINVTVAATPTRGRISFAELETPFVATRGRVSWAELEAPFVATRGRISWAELEVPLTPTRGRVSWAEIEVPNPPATPTRGLISWAELQVPDTATPTRGLISWAELETPLVPTRGRISWAELEAPLTPTRGRISWSEFEIPLAPTKARISFAEFEVPGVPTRGRISWAEFQVPDLSAGEMRWMKSRHWHRSWYG